MERKKGLRYGIPLHLVVIIMFLIGIVFSVLVIGTTIKITEQYSDSTIATEEFLACQDDVYNVKDTIHTLHEYARDFVVSGNTESVIQYFNEVQVHRSMESALEELKGFLVDDRTLKQLETAIELNDRMSEYQWYAMRLAIEAYGYDLEKYPVLLKTVTLSPEDLALTREEQRNQALSLLFSKDYLSLKNQVDVRIGLCQNALETTMTGRQQSNYDSLQFLLQSQRRLVFGLVAALLLVMLFVLLLVVYPIRKLVRDIHSMEKVNVYGASEIKFLAETYNAMYEQMQDTNDQLDYKATHDSLTGLYNRGAYEALWNRSRDENIALLIVDVDLFKEVNDTYGHDIGDRVLVRVARMLQDSFRDADKVCRIGGDEFSVIMIGVTSAVTEVIRRKIDNASRILNTPDGDVPGVTISVGCAFSDQLTEGEDLFKNADRALYRVKESGRNGCGFYKEEGMSAGEDRAIQEKEA